MRFRGALGLVGILAGLSLGGCAGATQNVRAYRAYAHEDASMRVTLDRIEDLARTLELVDRILLSTPYTPGDLWVRRLPLRDADARALRADIKDRNPYNTGEYEVPVLKIYRSWIEHVLDEYKAPPEKAMYPSLLDAMGALTTRAPSLKAHWTGYQQAAEGLGVAAEELARLEDELAGKDEATQKARAGELVAAKQKLAGAAGAVEAAKAELQKDAALVASDVALSSQDKKQIARDVFGAMSVAFRIELEALALMPIIVIQTVRSLPTVHRDAVVKPTLKTVRQMWQLPQYVTGIKERMTRQVVVLEGMTRTLSQALATSVEASPGFELRESVVDQIVGITLDSLRVDLKAGGEAFVFSSIPTKAQQSTNDGKETFDYRGRKQKLAYLVSPIILASARLDIVLDWIQLPGVASLGFGYSTDRMYQSGGTIEHTSLAEQLGLRGAYSSVFDFAAGLLGIRTSARIATWNAGKLQLVDALDVNRVIDQSKLQLTQTQLDAGYDVLFAVGDAKMRAFVEELVVGLRYVRYGLPRILYELRNVSTDPNKKTFVFSRESPPQMVAAQYFMGGFHLRFGQGEAPRFSPFFDMDLYGGAGPTNFYFLRDATLGDVESNRDYSKRAAFVFNGGLGAGIRWRLLPRGFRARLDLRAIYHADFIYTTINRSNDSDGVERRTDYGAVDVFHGPQLALHGAL